MAKKAAKRRPRLSTKQPATKPSVTDSADRVERALVAALKQHRGQKLTRPEVRDLAWHAKNQRDQIAREAYGAVPKGVFCAMAARQQRTIDDQAAKYGLDVDGPTIDLFLFVKSAFDLISVNAKSIQPRHITPGDEDTEEYVYKLKLAKLQEEVTKLKQTNESLGIRITRERGDTIDRHDLRKLLGWFSTRLEGFGQKLRNTTSGEDVQTTLNEFLEDLANECKHGVLQI